LSQWAVGFSAMRARFDAAFINAVRPAQSTQVEVYQETVEPRFPAAEQIPLLSDFLANKYAGRKIDAIVSIGVTSLAVARQAREQLGHPPIVATLSEAGQIDKNDDITGIQGGLFLNGTIDLALTLLPDTQSVLLIDGGFEESRILQADVEQEVKARS